MNKNLLIIGNSKAAKNFSTYLKFKKIKYKIIPYRKIALTHLDFAKYKTVFILTSDNNIIEFYKKFKKYLKRDTSLFHFSGAFYHKKIVSIHPIFSFKKKTIKPKDFEKVIFTSEKPQYVKKQLRWLNNKIIKINPQQKPYYHAILSIYLNFPLIIKNILEKEINKNFKISTKYLEYVFLKNITDSVKSKNDITGPIIRNDTTTIKKHLFSIKNTPYYSLYTSILKLWRSYDDK